MKFSDRHDFITDSNFHTLEISHTELDDSGEYSVTANNKVGGSITCRASLIVDKGKINCSQIMSELKNKENYNYQ